MGGDISCQISEQEVNGKELQAILQAANDVIITINHSGIVQQVNAALETQFGYTPQELIGRNISLLMPAHHAEEHNSYIERYLETGQRRIIGVGRELVARHKNGHLFPISLSVSQVAGFPRFVGIIRDMSQQVELEKECLQAGEMERNRISRELHDDLGQNLAGLAMQVRGMVTQLQQGDNRLKQQLLKLSEELQLNVSSIRQAIYQLATVELEEQGLEHALRGFVEHCNDYGVTRVKMISDTRQAIENYGVEVQLYRIAREAIHNALKHAEASLIEVYLEQTAGFVKLNISDNGRGLPPEVIIRDGRLIKDGHGLRNIHFRAHVIGANLRIYSTPGDGTRIHCFYSVPRESTRSRKGVSDEQGVVSR
jgi:two-component system, LuxR family, sensor kinase FixL